MDENDPRPAPKPGPKRKTQKRPATPPTDPREARLAKALRDNLRRRKQARPVAGSAAPADGAPPPEPLADD